jgi:arginase
VLAYTVIDVPSNLGLKPSGVERLPEALRARGLLGRLKAHDGGELRPAAPYNAIRDDATGLLNAPALRETMRAVASAVAAIIKKDRVPIVLAGDCSVLLGGLLGMRSAAHRDGTTARAGLLFVDGHVDFYQPDASPTGEVADMDLALATGRGPDVLARLDSTAPLVRDDDVAAVGARDRVERHAAGSQAIEDTAITLFEWPAVSRHGIATIAGQALAVVARAEIPQGFWLHLDADVLDDAVMPAVDYRQPGGLSPEDTVRLLRMAGETGRLAGVSVAIYNPELDATGRAGDILTDCLVAGLRSGTE